MWVYIPEEVAQALLDQIAGRITMSQFDEIVPCPPGRHMVELVAPPFDGERGYERRAVVDRREITGIYVEKWVDKAKP